MCIRDRHRLGIQAFEAVLVEGSAIQLHPLVCFAYNADFDGDQMAVHVPLSYEAVAEARQVMLSSENLLSPSDGEPVVAPTLDMVLGCYYLTYPGSLPEGQENARVFASADRLQMVYQLGDIGLQEPIKFKTAEGFIYTTVGRVLFNQILLEGSAFLNELMDKSKLKELVSTIHRDLGNAPTVELVDQIKDIGFRYATQSGMTIAVSDISVPTTKPVLMAEADSHIDEMEEQFQLGLITADEKYQSAINIWTDTTNRMQTALYDALPPTSSLAMMSNSGAKGNICLLYTSPSPRD